MVTLYQKGNEQAHHSETFRIKEAVLRPGEISTHQTFVLKNKYHSALCRPLSMLRPNSPSLAQARPIAPGHRRPLTSQKVEGGPGKYAEDGDKSKLAEDTAGTRDAWTIGQ